MVFKLYFFKMCFKVFSKFLIGFNGFQIVCFKLFPNNVFQSVFKNLPNVSMVFKLCVSKCFQIMCSKVFSKFSHRFQWFSNCMFSKCVSKCFQKSLIDFKLFSNYMFQSVFKFLIGFNGFQIMCFKVFFLNSP